MSKIFLLVYIFNFTNIKRLWNFIKYKKKIENKKNYFFNLLSSSSTEHVNLHLGNPLQPINSP